MLGTSHGFSYNNSRLTNSQHSLNSDSLLVIYPLHGPQRKHSSMSFIAARVTFGDCLATGQSLQSHYLVMATV
jgi:hypothetical protein